MKQIFVLALIIVLSYLVANLSAAASIAVTKTIVNESSQESLSKGNSKNLELHNHYIVTMEKNTSAPDFGHVIDLVKQNGGQVIQIYEHAIKGFSMSLPAVSANSTIMAIKAKPGVVSVEKDVQVNIAPRKGT